MTRPLTRITYRDPTTGSPTSDPTSHHESLVEYDEYVRPLEWAHNTALHTTGIATGLQVRAVRDQTGLRVLAGVAVTGQGDTVVLAVGGRALSGGLSLPVLATGVALTTAGLNGPHVLTVARAETTDVRTFDGVELQVTDHTPRLTLRPADVAVDARAEVVLVAVGFANGKVTTLDAGARRQTAGESAVVRPVPTVTGADLEVGAAVAGTVRPGADGGLEIAVGTGSLTVAAAGMAVRGPLSVETLTATTRLEITKQTRVSAALEARQGLTVSGATTLGATTVGGALTVDSITPTTRLQVDRGLVVGGGLLDAQKGVRVTGAPLDAQAGLTVAGATKLASGATVSGGVLDVQAGLNVGGGFTVAGQLGVGTLVASTRVYSEGDVVADGTAFVGQNLFVTGSTTIVGGSLSATDPGAGRQAVVGAAGAADVEDVWGYGVRGIALGPRGNGVYGEALLGDNAYGVWGRSTQGYGGNFEGRVAVRGTAGTSGVSDTGSFGMLATCSSTDGTGVKGTADTGASAYGIWGVSRDGWAGWFEGNVRITGRLVGATSGMQIDHPLDPEGKWLNHDMVSSPEMLTVHSGVVQTDESGRASVELPDWFEALNRDFTYQLTVLGRHSLATVEEEIADNRFSIRVDGDRVRVSWQVTGVRKDRVAERGRVGVEEVKSLAGMGPAGKAPDAPPPAKEPAAPIDPPPPYG